MYVMLCSAMDTSALWAASGLAGLLPGPLELVLAETLATGARWEHRVDSNETHLKVTLADGRVLCSSRIKGVVNRLMAPPQARDGWESKTELAYAEAEMHAFHLSWLQGLPCVMLNRPTPTYMGGSFFRTSEWVFKAAKAGFKTTSFLQTESDGADFADWIVEPRGAMQQSVVVAGGRVFPAGIPAKVRSSCAQLAKSTGMELMGVRLSMNEEGEWRFAGATASPDLTCGGVKLLEQMAAMLQGGVR